MKISTIKEFENYLINLELKERKELIQGKVICSFLSQENNLFYDSWNDFLNNYKKDLIYKNNINYIGYTQIIPYGVIFYFAK